ncbi:MAG: zinc-ribbon domain-containing protein, partial [Deltaproteobacteria bacterium]|nr:zinc-ribbon domain-containing protein [Deltaproteobacteria bacterium]
MIVSCPSCETKFEIPDDKYRPGRKARCSNCGNVFALPDMDGPASPVADVSVAREFSMPEDAPSIPEQSATEVPADGDAVPPDFASIDSDAGAGYGSDAGESPAVPAPPASLDDVVAPVPPAKADEKRSGKRLLFVLGTILVVAILAYGAVMVYT